MMPGEALKHFREEVPVLGLLGTAHYINPDTPYSVDEEVQLVCKYLKALRVGGLKGIDRLYLEGEGKWREVRNSSVTCLEWTVSSDVIIDIVGLPCLSSGMYCMK